MKGKTFQRKGGFFDLGQPSHPNLWAAGILLLVLLAFFGPVLFSPSQDLLFSGKDGDLARQFYAWRQFGFSEMRKGHLPLWNPYIFCGAPYFAGFQSALLYPPNWLFLCLPLVFALNFSIVLHFFLAGFFMFLWLSRNKISFPAALFGAFVFMFGGAFYLHLYPGHLPNLCTMAWIPLVFHVVDELLEEPRLPWMLGGMAATALQLLAGHVQYFVFTVFCGGIYFFFFLARSSRKWPQKTLYVFGALLGCFALTAVQWLTGLQAVGESLRSARVSMENQGLFALTPLNLLSLWMPGFNSNPSLFNCWVDKKPEIWWENSVFIGATASLLAVYGLVCDAPRSRRLGLLALVFLLLALGPGLPLLSSLYHWIPLLDFFRGSFKFNIFFQLILGYLAALGLEAWLKEPKWKAWPVPLAAGWALLLAAAGALVFHFSPIPGLGDLFHLFHAGPADPQYPLPTPPGQMEAAVAVNLFQGAALFLLLALLWFLSRRRPAFRYGVLLVGVLELVYSDAALRPTFSSVEMRKQDFEIGQKLGSTGDDRIYWFSGGNRSMDLRKPDIMGDDPLVLKRYGYFIAYIEGLRLDQVYPALPVLNRFTPAFRLMRFTYLITEMQGASHILKMPIPKTPPRALLVGKWRLVASGQEALQAAASESFDPTKEVLLEQAPDPLPRESPGGTVSLTDLSTDEVEVRAQLGVPQVLVVTDNYSKGWKAVACPDSIQRKYEVLPGNFIQRAIPLTAGQHHFYLKYEPTAFTAGKWVSLLSLLVYALAALGLARRRALPGALGRKAASPIAKPMIPARKTRVIHKPSRKAAGS